MNTDQHLILAAISAYIVSSLALLVYMLSRQQWAKTLGMPFAFIGCAIQFFELAYRFQTSHIWPLTNLYGSLSLFSAMSVVIFIGFALRYDVWFIGGLVQMIAAGFLAYALTWDEGYLPAVPAICNRIGSKCTCRWWSPRTPRSWSPLFQACCIL